MMMKMSSSAVARIGMAVVLGLAEVQAQTATPAPNPVLAYVFADLTKDIQWKGAVITAAIAFAVFVVVCIRDVFGLWDFGSVRKTLPLEQGQLSRSLTITSAAYMEPAPKWTAGADAVPEIIIQPQAQAAHPVAPMQPIPVQHTPAPALESAAPAPAAAAAVPAPAPAAAALSAPQYMPAQPTAYYPPPAAGFGYPQQGVMYPQQPYAAQPQPYMAQGYHFGSAAESESLAANLVYHAAA